MNKFFIKVIFLFFLISANANSEIINDIDVSGNKRISKETILVLGDIKLNKDFTKNDLNNTLKKLYETNFFSNISLSIKSGLLKITLVENPIIEKVELRGIKNKKILEKIEKEISLKNRMSFSENLLNRDVNLIKNIFKSSGYYFVEIDTSYIENKELNSIELNIDIDQGEKAQIKDIQFIGDKKIKDKKLLEVIASEEHKFWKVVSNKVYLNENLVNLDKRLLENFYKNEGYYNVEVLNSFAELDDKGSFKLIFNIKAGEKYFFNDIVLSLPDDYRKDDFKKIEKLFGKLKNEKYSINKVNTILKEIDIIASQKLYDFINAEVEETVVENNKINFDFKIKDSEKYYVERINVFGNYNTIEEVIRNQLIVDEGDPLNEVLFSKSINKLRSLGFFKKVNTEVVNGSNENLKIINISIEEQPTGEISMGAGYGSSGGTIGGGVT